MQNMQFVPGIVRAAAPSRATAPLPPFAPPPPAARASAAAPDTSALSAPFPEEVILQFYHLYLRSFCDLKTDTERGILSVARF